MTGVDFPGRAFRLQGENLLLGLYINELLYRLLGRHDPVPRIYDEYERLLGAMQQMSYAPRSRQHKGATLAGAMPGAMPVRVFELKLLQELGYGINFTLEVSVAIPLSQ